jgi:hypothetical protein
MQRATLGLVLALFVVTQAGDAAAVCKISYLLDRSSSMNRVRSGPQNLCVAAQNILMRTLQSLADNNVYGYANGEVVSTTDIYDQFCVAGPGRQVSIWVLQDNEIRNVTNGFIDARTALGVLEGRYFHATVAGPTPNDDCSGNGNMAQGMCRVVQQFGGLAPPNTEYDQMIYFGAGAEDASDTMVLNPGEFRCRSPGEDSTSWGPTVRFFFLNHPVDPWVDYFSLRTQQDVNASPTPIEAFLADLSSSHFAVIPDGQNIKENSEFADDDSDGIPNYRDKCSFNPTCPDADGDGIVLNDACPTDPEDGYGSFPTDGCPDRDADGIPTERDKCPTQLEDYLEDPTVPPDGCPSGIAVPMMEHTALGVLAILLGGCGVFITRRAVRRGAQRLQS